MPLTPGELATLVEQHVVPLKLWLRSRSSQVDDIVQEAFCRLAVQHPRPDRPVAWLYHVARNLAETDRIASRRRTGVSLLFLPSVEKPEADTSGSPTFPIMKQSGTLLCMPQHAVPSLGCWLR